MKHKKAYISQRKNRNPQLRITYFDRSDDYITFPRKEEILLKFFEQ